MISENTSTGFSLLSLVSSASKNNKGSNGAYSDMYALHERGESQSEADIGEQHGATTMGESRI